MYASEIYDPRAIVDAVVKERCTALHGVPTHFLGVLAEVERRRQAGEQLDLSQLRFIFSAIDKTFAEHIYQDRNRGWITRPYRTHEATDSKSEPARADECVRNEYALVSCHIPKTLIIFPKAETSPVSFQTTSTDSITQRVETVGRIRPHVSAKIVDPEGNIVPINTPGELLVSGYLLQKGCVLRWCLSFAD